MSLLPRSKSYSTVLLRFVSLAMPLAFSNTFLVFGLRSAMTSL